MQEVEVPSRQVFLHHIVVPKKHKTLLWWFSTKKHSISFGLFFRKEKLASSSDVFVASSSSTYIPPPPVSETNTTSQRSSRNLVRSRSSSEKHQRKPSSTESDLDLTDDHLHSSSSIRIRRKIRQGWRAKDPHLIELLPIQHYDSSRATVKGHFDTQEEGTYVLVFDNSFSLNTSKKLTFFVALKDSLKQVDAKPDISGWLLKKKRKRLPKWAKRWFVIEKGVLSYFKHPHSICRGTLQILLAAISVTPSQRLINLDSGTILYQLKAPNEENFKEWVHVLQYYKSTSPISADINDPSSPRSPHFGPLRKSMLFTDHRIRNKLSDMHQSFLNDFSILSESFQHSSPLETTHNQPKTPISTDHNQALRRIKQYHDWYHEALSALMAAPATTKDLYDNTLGRAISPLEPSRASIDSAEELFYDAVDIIEPDAESSEASISEDPQTPELAEDDQDSDDFEQDPDYLLAISSFDKLPNREHRKFLPVFVTDQPMNILSFLRKNIGKDLSTISMPVTFNEPLNLLQNLCEELEYSSLLRIANSCPDSIDRIMHVAAFVISPYAKTIHRVSRKPFNPLLGETFEYISKENNFRFIGEKVAHRPSIMACHAESDYFTFWQNSFVKTKFWGKSMEMQLLGTCHLTLPTHCDYFTYTKPTSWMRNMLSNNRYIEYSGEITLENHSTGEKALIYFKESGFFHSSNNEITVSIFDSHDNLVRTLSGKWNESLYFEKSPGQLEILWKPNPLPPQFEKMYGFTDFAITLNELHSTDILPKTDTRFRPDQRFLELGQIEKAASEKERLENRQRTYRRSLESREEIYSPKWFTFDHHSSDSHHNPEELLNWKFNQQYWKAKTSAFNNVDLLNLW